MIARLVQASELDKMRFLFTVLTLSTLIAAAFSQADGIKNTTQEYYLKTKLKPNQRGKARYDGLYLQTYHTGAGLSDAVLTKHRVPPPSLPIPSSQTPI